MNKAVESVSRWLLEKYKGKKPVPHSLLLSLCKRQAAWASARDESLDIEEMARLVIQNVAAKGLDVECLPASDNTQKTTAPSEDKTFTFRNAMDFTAFLAWTAEVLHDRSRLPSRSVLFSAKYL